VRGEDRQENRNADCAAKQRDDALKEQRDALQRAQDAAKKGGVFDWISDNLGLGGVAGLVTFNYAAVAASVAVHELGILKNMKIDVVDVGALATGRLDAVASDVILRKLDIAPEQARDIVAKCGIPKDAPGISDEDVKPVAKKVLMANLFIAGLTATALTGGSTAGILVAVAGVGISAGGSYVAENKALDGLLGDGTSKWVGLGMEIYGTAASALAGFAPGPAVISNGAARAVGGVVGGATGILDGSDQVVTTLHQRETDTAHIDEETARHRIAQLGRMMDEVIDTIQDAYDSRQKAHEIVMKAVETTNDTSVALATGMRV